MNLIVREAGADERLVARDVASVGGYWVVRDGRQEFVRVAEHRLTRLARRRGRFANTLEPESLLRIKRVIDVASSLVGEVATVELIAGAGAEKDAKGAGGCLRMLDVQGVIHAVPRRGRELYWVAGERPVSARVPRMVHRERYLRLRELLRAASPGWRATDWLVCESGFDTALQYRSGGTPRRERGLPANFFVDNGKSARKYVLGALKALYWLEVVAWRNHTKQAVEWSWVGSKGVISIPEIPSSKHDPYLDGDAPDRKERVEKVALDRWVSYNDRINDWLREKFPHRAWEYDEAQRVEKRRKARKE